MKLIALARPPASLDESVKPIAAALALSPAEVRMRLAGGAPALLAPAADGEAAGLVAKLRALKLAALAIDARAPTDRQRLVARRFAFGSSGLSLAARSGETLELPWGELLAVLRGARETRTDTARTETTYRLSGISTVGLGLPRISSQEHTVRSSESSLEQVLLIYGKGGEQALVAESLVDFSCLGKAMQPSSSMNMAELARLLKAKAPSAFHDDRLMRMGRRPLPFMLGAELNVMTDQVAVEHSSTAASLDALAEVMRQALAAGLLP